MRALSAIVLLLATSCGSVESHGPPDTVEAPPDTPAAPPDTRPNTGLVLVDSTLASGGGLLAGGTVVVIDDGLETFDRSCAASLCVTGGVSP
jgi:hypothetical protein